MRPRTPQPLLPKSLASRLNLWPPPLEAQLIEVEVAGRPVRNYFVPRALRVYVKTEDREVGPIECDVMIFLLEREVLIGDNLGGKLGIVILDLRDK
ncbi:MAG: hypothetical protein QW535_04175 [Candidatus Nezhaarchaeales archaeon]